MADNAVEQSLTVRLSVRLQDRSKGGGDFGSKMSSSMDRDRLRLWAHPMLHFFKFQ